MGTINSDVNQLKQITQAAIGAGIGVS